MSDISSDAENSALGQVMVLFLSLFTIGFGIIGNTTHIPQPTEDIQVEAFPTPDPNLISNPQIDESEAAASSESSAMAVAMFNLENPNGWETPSAVTLVGDFQSDLGCDDNFMLDCNSSQMTYDNLGDIWQASFDLPAGNYTYRAYLNKDEEYIYGKHGISGINSLPIELSLADSQIVHFYYDHKTGWITDDVNSLILTLASNFQEKVGCREEWDAMCFRTWLQDLEGDGIYTYETLHIPEGSWETRVAINGDMDTSYGQGESLDGDNIQLWNPNIGHLNVFSWDSNLNMLTIFTSNVPIRLSTDLPPLAPNE